MVSPTWTAAFRNSSSILHFRLCLNYRGNVFHSIVSGRVTSRFKRLRICFPGQLFQEGNALNSSSSVVF